MTQKKGAENEIIQSKILIG